VASLGHRFSRRSQGLSSDLSAVQRRAVLGRRILGTVQVGVYLLEVQKGEHLLDACPIVLGVAHARHSSGPRRYPQPDGRSVSDHFQEICPNIEIA
jgi:hypothetical protein